MELAMAGLTRTYPGGVRALDGVTLSIGPGVFGLLGPNGAGKSTLMRILATLQRPDSGSVRFGDIDVLRDPASLRQQLGYLPQDFGFYPNVSAEAILDHFARLKGYGDRSARRAVVDALLVQVNLYDNRRKSVGGFSGGMRQRLGIATALLGEPNLIIVDEPTAGLDPVERNRFLNLLADLGERAVVLLSTHIVEDVAALCERVAILVSGRIAAAGSPDEIVAPLSGRVWRRTMAPGEDETRLAARAPILSRRLIAGRTMLSVLADFPPDSGFLAADPDLEDAYFVHIRGLGPQPDVGRTLPTPFSPGIRPGMSAAPARIIVAPGSAPPRPVAATVDEIAPGSPIVPPPLHPDIPNASPSPPTPPSPIAAFDMDDIPASPAPSTSPTGAPHASAALATPPATPFESALAALDSVMGAPPAIVPAVHVPAAAPDSPGFHTSPSPTPSPAPSHSHSDSATAHTSPGSDYSAPSHTPTDSYTSADTSSSSTSATSSGGDF